MDAPGEFRRAATDTNAPSTTNSLADLGWWETFRDTQLSAYLSETLTNSWDIKIAAARVLGGGWTQPVVQHATNQ